MSTYFCLHLSQVPHLQEDAIVEACFTAGASGVAENLEFRQPDLTYDPETVVKEFLDLDVYFVTSPGSGFIELLQSRFPAININLKEEANKDWMEEWKKGFQSFPLVEGVWVVPSWLTPPAEACSWLSLDPGMAFGTGTHETTQIAAQAIYNVATNKEEASLLDVGTGTGILALLAEHLGFAVIHGVEIDVGAREVARENCAVNRAQKIKILDDSVEGLSGTYDVVVANIIDGVLLQIQAALWDRLAPDGILIVTGIYHENHEVFRKQFRLKPDYSWGTPLTKGDWLGYCLKPNE